MTNEKYWNFEKDELLIEMVKSGPGLYDLQSPYYSDNNYKKKMWEEIEEAVGLTGAKIRWESLRGQYRKYLGKIKTKSGQASTKISKWRYCDQIQFLNDYLIVNRPRVSSISLTDESEVISEELENHEEVQATSFKQNDDREEVQPINDSINTSVIKPSIIRKKKKRNNANFENVSASSTLMKYILENSESDRLDAIDHFFQLMAATVKKFSAIDQHVLKNKIFNIVSEMEEKYLRQTSSPFSLSSPVPSSDSPSPSNFFENNQSNSHISTPSSEQTTSQNFTGRTIILSVPPTQYNGSIQLL